MSDPDGGGKLYDVVTWNQNYMADIHIFIINRLKQKELWKGR